MVTAIFGKVRAFAKGEGRGGGPVIVKKQNRPIRAVSRRLGIWRFGHGACPSSVGLAA